MLIKEAYSVLSCKQKKKAFDQSIQNNDAQEWTASNDFVFEKSQNARLDAIIQDMMREQKETPEEAKLKAMKQREQEYDEMHK